MAKEVLSIPEQHLRDTVRVIRAGLEVLPEIAVHPDCRDAEEYLDR